MRAHHHDVVSRHVRDLLVAHDAEVRGEEDEQRRVLVDVVPVLERLCAAAKHARAPLRMLNGSPLTAGRKGTTSMPECTS